MKLLVKLLQEFLNEAPKGLPDLERIENRRLAKPDDPAFRGKLIDDWVLFLRELGVEIGLTPELKSVKRKVFQAYRIRNFSFVEDYGIPLEFREYWRSDISEQDPSLLDFDYSTGYVIDGAITWLPGQADFDRFTGVCKERYAKLILLWLSENSNVPWSVTVHHEVYYHADHKKWPTPLKSFLRSARWFSVQDPAASTSDSVEVRPCELWVNTKDNNHFEPFLRRPIRDLRSYFNHGSYELVKNLKNHCDLHIFDDPPVLSQQLEFLSQQFLSHGFNKHFESRLINIYDRTWQLLTKRLGDDDYKFYPASRPSKILVRRGERYELMSMLDHNDDEGECLYVCDTNREGDVSLIVASGRPFFCLRGRDVDGEKIGKSFKAFYGQQVRCLSQVPYKLLADGMSIESCVGTSVLEICPQLRAMIATAMEALSGMEAQRLPADREKVLVKLEPLNFVKVERLRFVIDELDVSINQDECQAFYFKFEDKQSVIAVQSPPEFSEEWTWNLVDISIPAVCEALGGLSALVPHLRLLVKDLSHGESLQRTESNPADDVRRFSSILRLSSSESQAASVSLSAGVARYAQWIRAVLHYLLGDDAVDAFNTESNKIFEDINLVHDTLSCLLDGLSVSAERVIDSCRSALNVGEVRKKLGFEFERF